MTVVKFISLVFLLVSFFAKPAEISEMTGVLVVEFENLKADKGEIEVIIFDNKRRFLRKNKSLARKRVPVVGGRIKAEFHGLPYGIYAIVSYHDVNTNQRFDRNIVGLPKEPYAFSKGFESKLRKPRFTEVAVELNSPEAHISLEFITY